MTTIMIRIALVLVILIFGAVLIKLCIEILTGVCKELGDGIEEWKQIKEELKDEAGMPDMRK